MGSRIEFKVLIHQRLTCHCTGSWISQLNKVKIEQISCKQTGTRYTLIALQETWLGSHGLADASSFMPYRHSSFLCTTGGVGPSNFHLQLTIEDQLSWRDREQALALVQFLRETKWAIMYTIQCNVHCTMYVYTCLLSGSEEDHQGRPLRLRACLLPPVTCYGELKARIISGTSQK